MQQDFVALQWVSGEIGETAEQLQRELLGFADNLSDPTRLRHSLTLAHQMHATLRLLNIGSAEQLARELEHCIQAMLHGQIPSSEASLQLMLAATLQLPAYLRRIAQERRELPFDVHALVNELRAARGEDALPSPVIDRSLDTGELALGTGAEAEPALDEEVQLLRKVRQRLQAELLGLLRGEPPQEHLHALARVFALLAQRLRPGGHRYFWQSCTALCDAVLHGGLAFDERISGCIRDIDAELRAGVALETGFYTRAPSEALYRQLLELIALSRPASPVLAEIQQRHRLIPDRPGDAPTALEDLGATNAAVGVIAADLAQVLEKLETTEGDAASVGRVLREVEPELRKVANLLAGLGYREEHEILLPQIEGIGRGLLLQGAELDEHLTGITAALLDVDQRLAARAIEAGASDVAQVEARQHPLARARVSVCREVHNGIEQTKQAISDYVSSEAEIQLLAASPARLHELWGALRLAGLDGAAHVLSDCRTYVTEVLVGARTPPGVAEVDAFADALSSVEYFIERLLIDRVPAELILVRARESMRNLILGHAPAPAPELQPGPAPLQEPADELLEQEPVREALDIAEPAAAPDVVVEPEPAFAAEPAAEPAEPVLEMPAEAETARAWQPEIPITPEEPVVPAAIAPEPEIEFVEAAQTEPLATEQRQAELEPESEGEAPDPEIVEIFVEEANEVLQTIAAQLPLWRASPGSGAALTELRRAFHTLKGSGRMVGAEVVGELAWSIENLLNRVLERTVAIGPDVFEVIDRAHLLMPGLVDAFATRRRVDRAGVELVQDAATALARGMPVRWAAAADAAQEPATEAVVEEAVIEPQFAQPEPVPDIPAEAVEEFSGEAFVSESAPAVASTPDLAETAFELSPELVPEEVPEAALPLATEFATEEALAQPAPPAVEEEVAEESEPLDPEIVEIFVEEATEVLQTIAEQLPVWRAAPVPGAALTELRRAFHTLKGSGRMVGANVIGELAWSIENLLNRIIDRSVSAGPDVLEAIERARALMPSLVEAFATHTRVDGLPVQHVQDAATALARGMPVRWGDAAATEPTVSQPELLEAFEPAQGAEPVAAEPELLIEFESVAEPELLLEPEALLEPEVFLEPEVLLAPEELPEAEVQSGPEAQPEPGVVIEPEIAAEPEAVVEAWESTEPATLGERAVEEPTELTAEPVAEEGHLEHAAELEDWLPELEPEELAAAQSQVPQEAELSRESAVEEFVPELQMQFDAEPGPAEGEEPALTEPVERELEPLLAGEALEEPDAPVLGIFAEEAAEHLAMVRGWLAGQSAGTVSDGLIRGLHTLRGSAFAAGIDALGTAIAPLEELVRAVGLDGEPLDAASRQLLESFAALLAELVDAGMRPGEAWVARADALRSEATDRLAQHQAPPPQAGVSPAEQRVGRFLEEALQALFHATSLLESWRQVRETEASRDGLLAELRGIHQKAGQLGVGGLSALTGPLLAAITPVAERGAQVADTLFDTIKQGLEACLDALDRIAAGQLPDTPVALIAALEALAAVPVAVVPAPTGPVVEAAPAVDVLRARVARDLVGAELELLDIFLEEAEELMAAIDEDIDAWRHDRRDREPFEKLQRGLHTLKGGARMAGLRYLGELAHNFETFLINQSVHFGSFDDGFFARVADYHEQLAQTMDIVRERPVLREEPPTEPAQPVLSEPVSAPEPLQALQPEPEALQAEEGAVELVMTPAPVQVAHTELAVEPAEPEPEPKPEPTAPASATGDAELRRSVASDLAQAEVDLLDIFLEEAEELMASIDSGIDAWRGDRGNRAPYDRLQRDLHTLKGGARMAGLKTLGNRAHDFETMLIGEGSRIGSLDDRFFARVADYHEQLAQTMDIVRARPAVEPEEVSVAPVLEQPQAPREEVPATPAPRPVEALGPLAEIPRPPVPVRPVLAEGSVAVVAAKPPAFALPTETKQAPAKVKDEVVRVSAQLLEDLVNLAGETSISRGRVEEQVSELGNLFDEMQATIERLQGQVRRLDIATEAQILFRRERAESEGTEGFDPLEMDRYSQLQQLSRSLVESASDVLDIKRTLAEKARDLETVLIQQSRINSQLQEGLMRSRMVPFSSILPRIKRVVRQVAQELDKSVEFELGNMAGELDRGILERVVAPLEHMLRNAVDHGIESREKRRAAGKPETGRILIEIARDGGDVLIAISDDGAGVNLAAVRAKALERGLMEADSPLSDHEVIQFILHSGFSTATKVTQISGRGVGMDVVSSEIRQMGGSLEIHSTQGQGSRFTIRLPFTVSVSRALLVNVGTEIFALPLNTVEGVVRMRSDELARYIRDPAERFQYAGQSYEVEYLGTLLYPGEQLDLNHLEETVPVVLVRGGGQSLAVEVDKLIGAREIVVKGLGPQFGAVPGLSGATVLGDGSVVLIIDVPAMLRADAARGAQMDAEARRASRGQQVARAPLIMVVDDSVTVRKVTTRFLEREGMRVVTAKDGADAMVKLQEQVPDLMLLDIEMPHMDGFEVVSKVRLSDTLKHLPIIMITSRTGEKHRERALSLGANMYLGKPYQESVLIEHINALLARQPSR